MSNPTCTAAELIDNAKNYTSETLNPQQRAALLIHAQVLELATLGGDDYSATIDTTLIEDAESLARAMTEDQLQAARIQIAYNNADAAGAAVPDLDTKLSATSRLALADPKTLHDIALLLACKLGVHKAYPQ